MACEPRRDGHARATLKRPQAGCRAFYSEDLHHGQRIEGLTIRNPFQN
jgi:predicted nucleic acid-binding protein